VGLGSDRFGGEFSRTGEECDDRVRGAMLDEALEILTAAWSGETVHHHGEHYTVDDVRFLPRPVQRPGVPVWAAGFPGNTKPMRRAARLDGFFPVNITSPDQLAETVARVNALREDPTAPYDFAVDVEPGADITPYAKAGATWCLTGFDPEAISVDQVRGVLRDGPSQSGGTPAGSQSTQDPSVS
jgi:alkanesulfonate monooxygenase SsuD/methylene tetrahydromethanopterin reductase-like flavin-dependent oxidoreductase (luciferase family)